MIERLDVNIGRLVKHLKEIGEYENTLIVFMADNGAEGNNVNSIVDTGEWVEANFDNRIENIGRKNSYIFTGPSWAQVSSLPFRWYKSFATEGGVRTPAIISYPMWENTHGTINNDFISVMDLAPTFLEFAGIEHPGEEYDGRTIYSMDGISLLPWLKGDVQYAHNPDEIHCWELYGRRSALRGNWKAEWLDAPYGNNDWELFDLENDPGGLTNLAESHPDILEELITAWDSYARAYNLILPVENVAYLKDEIWRE
jgi:arylsulfatase